MEEWKPVSGFDSYYEVSDLGRVKRVGCGGNRAIVGAVLKPGILKGGYHGYTFCVDRVRTSVVGHRMVVEAFIGPIPEGMHVNHKNGITSDNRVVNLEIVTPSENTLHGFRVLGRKALNGSRLPQTIITETDIPRIFELSKSGVPQTKIAKQFGVSRSTISAIIIRRNGHHVKLPS